jgi:hypothetical protein
MENLEISRVTNVKIVVSNSFLDQENKSFNQLSGSNIFIVDKLQAN